MPDEYSQRAVEVARDLLIELEAEAMRRGLQFEGARFRFDGSNVVLNLGEAVEWIKQSVDSGYPEVRGYVEREDTAYVTVNLAAFEDPDSQYWP